jgi:signal transduction histidine kinase
MQDRMLRIGGLLTWLAVGVPVAINATSSPARLALWFVAFAAFGIGFITRILSVQTAAVIAMVAILCNGFEGSLLALIAMQLGSVMSRRPGVWWVLVQTALFFAAISFHWSPRPAFLLTPPYLGFQLLAFFGFEMLAREAAARRELAGINAMLAESSRVAERLRISRELHDALGHHLTALALNLEAALHRSDDASRERLETAQKLAKSLLADVRSIASTMQHGTALDLEKVLRPLVDDVPRPRVHLDVGGGLRVEDPERANIVVRCTQEIVTNAARHSSAENLWIVIGREGDVVRIHARDDGRGSMTAAEGFGLRSMRDRVEGAGGELRVDAHPGAGFEVVARVPA